MRPESLCSHSDQQQQWQTSLSEASSATGWGGRLADVTSAEIGGFDTHNNELATQQNLLGQLSRALKAFHDATGDLGFMG